MATWAAHAADEHHLLKAGSGLRDPLVEQDPACMIHRGSLVCRAHQRAASWQQTAGLSAHQPGARPSPGPAGVWLLARCADLQGLEYDVRRFGLCLLALFGLGLLFRCSGTTLEPRHGQFLLLSCGPLGFVCVRTECVAGMGTRAWPLLAPTPSSCTSWCPLQSGSPAGDVHPPPRQAALRPGPPFGVTQAHLKQKLNPISSACD